jgi:hypothetical protein
MKMRWQVANVWGILDLLYRFALSFFVKLTEFLKSKFLVPKIQNCKRTKMGSLCKGNNAKENMIFTKPDCCSAGAIRVLALLLERRPLCGC